MEERMEQLEFEYDDVVVPDAEMSDTDPADEPAEAYGETFYAAVPAPPDLEDQNPGHAAGDPIIVETFPTEASDPAYLAGDAVRVDEYEAGE